MKLATDVQHLCGISLLTLKDEVKVQGQNCLTENQQIVIPRPQFKIFSLNLEIRQIFGYHK